MKITKGKVVLIEKEAVRSSKRFFSDTRKESGRVFSFFCRRIKRFFGSSRKAALDVEESLEKAVQGKNAILPLNARRRAFLKYAVFGGAVFLLGKYLNPLMNMFRGETVLSEKTFENFKITETGKQLRVTDDEGGELLVIDKEGF